MGVLFVRWLISDGFVRQSKRALTDSGTPVYIAITGIYATFSIVARVS